MVVDKSSLWLMFQRQMKSYISLLVFTRPNENEVVVTCQRRIVEHGLAMLFASQVPLVYWSLVCKTVIFLLNRPPSKVLNFQYSYGLLYLKKPSLIDLNILGVNIFPSDYSTKQIQSRSIICVFLGYTSKKGVTCILSQILRNNK